MIQHPVSQHMAAARLNVSELLCEAEHDRLPPPVLAEISVIKTKLDRLSMRIKDLVS